MTGSITVEEAEKLYGAIVTDLGNELMMNAVKNGKKVAIEEFAVGDGNGEYYKPQKTMTSLKKEMWRGKINSCEIDEKAKNILTVTAICPGDVGGFTIREMAIFDSENNMIAICNCPDTPKVTVIDGVINELRLRMNIALICGDSVELVLDPSIITATKEDIEKIINRLDENGKVTIGTAAAAMEKNELRLLVDKMPY